MKGFKKRYLSGEKVFIFVWIWAKSRSETRVSHHSISQVFREILNWVSKSSKIALVLLSCALRLAKKKSRSFRPIRFKTGLKRDLVILFFTAPKAARVLIGSSWSKPVFWLAVVITLILVLRHSIENHSIYVKLRNHQQFLFFHIFTLFQDTHDTGTKINTQNHKAFMAKRRWKVGLMSKISIRAGPISWLFSLCSQLSNRWVLMTLSTLSLSSVRTCGF